MYFRYIVNRKDTLFKLGDVYITLKNNRNGIINKFNICCHQGKLVSITRIHHAQEKRRVTIRLERDVATDVMYVNGNIFMKTKKESLLYLVAGQLKDFQPNIIPQNYIRRIKITMPDCITSMRRIKLNRVIE